MSVVWPEPPPYVPEVVPSHVSRLLTHRAWKTAQIAKIVDHLLVSVAEEGETPAHGAVCGTSDVELAPHRLAVGHAVPREDPLVQGVERGDDWRGGRGCGRRGGEDVRRQDREADDLEEAIRELSMPTDAAFAWARGFREVVWVRERGVLNDEMGRARRVERDG